MGRYGLFLIAALIIASGIIAYVGDVIGRRMGRRRLTLFGLRPRYTAVVISVIAGMLIAGFTLLAAMLVSQNVRDGLLHAEALRARSQRLETVARELELGIRRSKRLATAAQRDFADARQRLDATSAALEAQTVRLNRQRRELERRQRELSATRGRLTTVSQELERKIAELAAQRAKVEEVGAHLAEVTAELERNRQELAAQQKELDRAREALATTQQKLDSETKKLTEARAELASVNQQLENATRSAFRVGRELIGLYNERDQLQAQIKDLNQRLSAAGRTFQVIRTQPVIFGANEEILTAVVPGGRPAAEVRADLGDFVTLVNQVAQAAGAGAQEGGRSIDISRQVWDDKSNQAVTQSEDQVLTAMAKEIAAASGSIIVRASSLGNVVRGETVLVDFQLFYNELVFRQGEELASTTVDSSKDQAGLLLDLVTFLRGKVSRRAREKGVMARPAARIGAARETAFSGPEVVVGEIAYPDLLEVIRQIKRRQGMVQVVARAASDTWTAGPVQIKLVVGERGGR
jgi:uncharacterized protein (DUF3084 family)